MMRNYNIPTERGKVPLNKTDRISAQVFFPFRGFLYGLFSGPERDIRFVFVGIGAEQDGIETFPLHVYRIPGKTRIKMRQIFLTDDKMEHRSACFDIPNI
jgi:hypothetical protein